MIRKQFLIRLLIILMLFSVFIYFTKKRKQKFTIGSQVNTNTSQSELMTANEYAQSYGSAHSVTSIDDESKISEYLLNGKTNLSDIMDEDEIKYCNNESQCSSVCNYYTFQLDDNGKLTIGNAMERSMSTETGLFNTMEDTATAFTRDYIGDGNLNGVCITPDKFEGNEEELHLIRTAMGGLNNLKNNIYRLFLKTEQFLEDNPYEPFINKIFFSIEKLKLNEIDTNLLSKPFNLQSATEAMDNLNIVAKTLQYHISEKLKHYLDDILTEIRTILSSISVELSSNLDNQLNQLEIKISKNEQEPYLIIDDNMSPINRDEINIYDPRTHTVDELIQNGIDIKNLLNGFLNILEDDIVYQKNYTDDPDLIIIYDEHLTKIHNEKILVNRLHRELIDFQTRNIAELFETIDESYDELLLKIGEGTLVAGFAGVGGAAAPVAVEAGGNLFLRKKQVLIAEAESDKIKKQIQGLEDVAVVKELLEISKLEKTTLDDSKFKIDQEIRGDDILINKFKREILRDNPSLVEQDPEFKKLLEDKIVNLRKERLNVLKNRLIQCRNIDKCKTDGLDGSDLLVAIVTEHEDRLELIEDTSLTQKRLHATELSKSYDFKVESKLARFKEYGRYAFGIDKNKDEERFHRFVAAKMLSKGKESRIKSGKFGFDSKETERRELVLAGTGFGYELGDIQDDGSVSSIIAKEDQESQRMALRKRLAMSRQQMQDEDTGLLNTKLVLSTMSQVGEQKDFGDLDTVLKKLNKDKLRIESMIKTAKADDNTVYLKKLETKLKVIQDEIQDTESLKQTEGYFDSILMDIQKLKGESDLKKKSGESTDEIEKEIKKLEDLYIAMEEEQAKEKARRVGDLLEYTGDNSKNQKEALEKAYLSSFEGEEDRALLLKESLSSFKNRNDRKLEIKALLKNPNRSNEDEEKLQKLIIKESEQLGETSKNTTDKYKKEIQDEKDKLSTELSTEIYELTQKTSDKLTDLTMETVTLTKEQKEEAQKRLDEIKAKYGKDKFNSLLQQGSDDAEIDADTKTGRLKQFTGRVGGELLKRGILINDSDNFEEQISKLSSEINGLDPTAVDEKKQKRIELSGLMNKQEAALESQIRTINTSSSGQRGAKRGAQTTRRKFNLESRLTELQNKKRQIASNGSTRSVVATDPSKLFDSNNTTRNDNNKTGENKPKSRSLFSVLTGKGETRSNGGVGDALKAIKRKKQRKKQKGKKGARVVLD